MKIFLTFLILFISLSQNLFSQNNKQDSALKKYSVKIPFDTNKIKEATLLSGSSEVFSYDSLYIWSDKRSLSEIMNERSGYFINDFGLGGRNLIDYNGYSTKDVGIFRDGIQVNDILFGGFDVQNFSVNEIDRIEEVSNVSSFLYGMSSTAKSINVITKDVFQSKPFSQFRYSQDRYNSLFADVVFNLPFSRKVSWMAGATKHSIDGRYANSEFDVWNARTRLDFFTSPKFNLKLNFYYDNIKRGLNEGLINSGNEAAMEENTAPVVNTSSNENIENFFYNATLTGRFFKDKSSLTKLMLYSNNTIRWYDNKVTLLVGGNTVYNPPANYHYIQYAADLKQNINLKFNRYCNLDFLVGGNAYLNYYNYSGYNFFNVVNKEYTFLFRADFNYENFFLSGFGNYIYLNKDESQFVFIDYENKTPSYYNIGTESGYKFLFSKNVSLKLFGGINNIQQGSLTVNHPGAISYFPSENEKTYYEAGFEFNVKDIFNLKSYYFDTYNSSGYSNFYQNLSDGVNTSAGIFTKYVDAYINYDYLNSDFYPENFLKADIFYHNFLFNNKLNLKTGFNVKYFSSPDRFYNYSQSYYTFYAGSPVYLDVNGFQVDYYIGARIGHANVNLTIANIFNTFYYDTYLYPADNRGGLLNAISRFTIVWDFLN